MRSISFRVFVGMVAGLAAWAITAPSCPQDVTSNSTAAWETWELLFLSLLGAFIGGGIGAVNGYLTGGKVHTLRGLGLGCVLGMLGIVLGDKIGTALVDVFFGSNVFVSGNIARAIPARILALTPMGAALGAAIGASTLSPKRVMLGLVGGALGGAIGGGVFDPVGVVVGTVTVLAKGVQAGQQVEVGATSRAIFAIALGLAIGLFIGVIENLAKSAWLRQAFGRNEGREWPIYGQHTVIGRSELCNVPIFGDPTLQPFHATISRQGDQYFISDGGGGVLIDGHPVSQSPLYSGATIQLGRTILQFLMKEGHAPEYVPEVVGVPAYPIGGQAVSQMPAGSFPMRASQPTVMAPMPASQPTVMTPAQPATLSLVATDGPLAGQRFPVSQPMEVGRDCPAIPIGFDTSSSRRHAGIAPAAGGLSVSDLGSTNGVFVNGQRVQNALVTPGSLLRIGATTFRVE